MKATSLTVALCLAPSLSAQELLRYRAQFEDVPVEFELKNAFGGNDTFPIEGDATVVVDFQVKDLGSSHDVRQHLVMIDATASGSLPPASFGASVSNTYFTDGSNLHRSLGERFTLDTNESLISSGFADLGGSDGEFK